MVDAGAHQPLQQHQPHEAAADHRHPVTGAGAGVIQPGDHTAHRLDDPALQRDVGVGDAQRPLGGHVVHGGEAARHHRIALRQAADAGAHLEHPAHALVPRRRRARGVAAVPVGVQVPRADAARGRAHLHLARSGIGNRRLDQTDAAARLVLNGLCLHLPLTVARRPGIAQPHAALSALSYRSPFSRRRCGPDGAVATDRNHVRRDGEPGAAAFPRLGDAARASCRRSGRRRRCWCKRTSGRVGAGSTGSRRRCQCGQRGAAAVWRNPACQWRAAMRTIDPCCAFLPRPSAYRCCWSWPWPVRRVR